MSLSELPEGARHAVRRWFRTSLLPRCLTDAELDKLATGDATLRGLAAVALTRAVDHAGSADGVALALAVLDLYEQMEAHVPFDSQTALWRVWNSAEPRSAALQELGRRMGFEVAANGGAVVDS